MNERVIFLKEMSYFQRKNHVFTYINHHHFHENILISHVLKKVTYCSDVATGPLQGLLGCENMMIFYD